MPDEFGLKKSERNANRARENEKVIEPLDPPFPYEVITVDWDFFDVSANPPTEL